MPNDSLNDCLAGKKILVTGAAGFIGSHLVEKLVELAASVTVIAPGQGWRPTVNHLVKQKRIRLINPQAFGNPLSLQRTDSDLAGTEHLVHLGYEMPCGQTYLEKAIDDGLRNVWGTLKLIQRLPASVSKICFASSVSVYGARASQPVKETDCPSPDTVYAVGKLAVESYLRQYAQEAGVSVSILRYATVYGPMETTPRAIPSFIRQVLGGKPPVINGDGKDVRDYVHVRDVARATCLALASKIHGVQIYNIGSGRGYATREIAGHIIRLAGQPMRPVYRPEERSHPEVVCDISRAQSELGYEPQVSLEDGLNDEIQWFRNNPEFWK